MARKPKLPALTGIRWFAAVNIMFFHFFNPAWFGPFSAVVNLAYVDVSFFLLLSGFILAYNYSDRAQAGKLSATRFWKARFSRLYPIYLLSLLVSFGMLMQEFHARTHFNFVLGIVLTLLMLQGWNVHMETFWNTPAWTMSTEAFFYLLFPWLATRRRPTKQRTVLLLMLVFWLAGMILPLLYMYFKPDGTSHWNRSSSGTWLNALKFMPVEHLPSFLFGMALAFLHDRIPAESRVRLGAGILGTASLLVLLRLGSRVPYPLGLDGLLMPVFAGIILCLAGRNILARCFSFVPLVALGEASYCLYLLHFNLWNVLHSSGLLQETGLISFDPWISYFLVVVIALAAQRYIERPARQWITNRWTSRPAHQ